MINRTVSVLFWNAHGLGQTDKCMEIKRVLTLRLPSIVCLQESKLEEIPHFKKLSLLPAPLQSLVFLPYVGASGGIVTAWNQNDFELITHSLDSFSLTTHFRTTASDLSFSVTIIYSPCDSTLKHSFLAKLISIASSIQGAWALVGDFNMIWFPGDKSNDNFDVHEASIFNEFINDSSLLEIPLLDRRYTWTNNQSEPTLVHLDRALVNTNWNVLLPNSSLTALPRPVSDHVPLALLATSNIPRPSVFRLNNNWLTAPSFQSLVAANWSKVHETHHRASSSAAALCLRLKRTRSAARAWAKRQTPLDVLIANCETLITFLDLLEELRLLSHQEFALRILIRTSLARLCDQRVTYWRQHGKVRQCILGDENTAYHHQCATIRLQHNKTKSLTFHGVSVFSHSG